MSFRVKRMRELHPAALKHGIEAADIKHALRVLEREEGLRVYLGPARNGELLEVITSRRPDGFEVAIHAMKMRPKICNPATGGMSVEPKNYGRNLKGELITEELIEKISREAEEGWEIEELLTWTEIDPAPESASSEEDQESSPRRFRRRR